MRYPQRNRATRAREMAGLSVGQAARLTGIDPTEIERAEMLDEVFEEYASKFADIYFVNLAWLRGDSPRYAFEEVDNIRGAETLSSHDREAIAEFIASCVKK